MSTTTTTPPPPPVDLDTAAKVQEALGAACAGEGADFNQKGMEVGGVEHKACATAENGDTNSIVYSWTSATEPATLSSNTQQQTKDYLQRGMPVCLIESAEHKWALQVFDTKTVGKPANIMSEVDRGHATVAAGTC